MDESLSAELLERADRDQAARMSLRPRHEMPEWESLVAPVDRDNRARLREIVAQYEWPGHSWLVRRAALGLEPEAERRARLLAAEGLNGQHQDDQPGSGG